MSPYVYPGIDKSIDLSSEKSEYSVYTKLVSVLGWEEDLQSTRRDEMKPLKRKALAVLLYNYKGFSKAKIARLLGRDRCSVYHYLRTHKGDYKTCATYRAIYDSAHYSLFTSVAMNYVPPRKGKKDVSEYVDAFSKIFKGVNVGVLYHCLYISGFTQKEISVARSITPATISQQITNVSQKYSQKDFHEICEKVKLSLLL
jgi:predicted transcriptional regulator